MIANGAHQSTYVHARRTTTAYNGTDPSCEVNWCVCTFAGEEGRMGVKDVMRVCVRERMHEKFE